MDHVRRVIVHDKPPVFEAEVFVRLTNRVVLGVGGLALLLQLLAIGQVIVGQGKGVGLVDHISFAAVALLWLALGVQVFLQRRAGRTGRLFLLSAAVGSIFLSLGTLYNANWLDAFLFATGLLFFPALLLSFTRAFHDERPWRRKELLFYLLPLLLLWPSADALHSNTTTMLWRVALVVVGIYLVSAIAQAIWDLLHARTAEQAAQSRALVFGLVAGTVPGTATFVMPIVLTTSLVVTMTWLPIIILLFLLAMSYAVLLFEFSEADLIVRRGVVYAVLTFAISLAYAALGVLLAAGGTAVTSTVGGIGFVAVTVLVGVAFAPIRHAARRLVDWVLYGRRADRWELLQALSARLAIVMQPDELGDVLVREIADALHLRGAFLLRRCPEGFAVCNFAGAASRLATRYEPLPKGFLVPAPVVEEALGQPAEAILIVHRRPATAKHSGRLPDRYAVLDALHAALSIPLVTRSGLEAVLCLRPKLAHDAIDADDLELLAPVIRQAAAALDNALLFSRLEEKVDELRDAYRRIAREQEAERARLARELHDGTAQELASLMTLASVAERQMQGADGAVHTTLERLRHQAEDAYQGVRRASHALRPLMLDDFGLSPTLDRYLGQFEEATGITVERSLAEVGSVPDDVELALFRVVQECMENVRKHSGADAVTVRLRREGQAILLGVSDDGRGIADDGERGIGLAGMRERIESVGGTIHVHNQAEGGVRVDASVPLLEESWKATVPGLS